VLVRLTASSKVLNHLTVYVLVKHGILEKILNLGKLNFQLDNIFGHSENFYKIHMSQKEAGCPKLIERPKRVLENHHKGETCVVLTPAEKERKTKKSERNK
jgi:hypothetical protein